MSGGPSGVHCRSHSHVFLPGAFDWDELIQIRDQQRRDKEDTLFVVSGDDLAWELNPMGLVRWYTHPAAHDTAHRMLIAYVQRILPGSRSGLLQKPGGQILSILEGTGHTVIDGVTFLWEVGDTLQLSMRWSGVVHQHFNGDPENNVPFLAVQAIFADSLGVDRGQGLELLNPCPEYREKSGNLWPPACRPRGQASDHSMT